MEEQIDVKIGTPVEAEWTKILKAQESALINSEINQEIAEILIKLAKNHISEEEAK